MPQAPATFSHCLLRAHLLYYHFDPIHTAGSLNVAHILILWHFLTSPCMPQTLAAFSHFQLRARLLYYHFDPIPTVGSLNVAHSLIFWPNQPNTLRQ